MASKVEICNKALILLGQDTIMSLNDNSPRARVCFQEFDMALEATLRSYPWPFAIKRKTLARIQEKPEFGYAHYYELPTDCLRVIKLEGGNGRYQNSFDSASEYEYKPPYQIEGGRVATDASNLLLRYVSSDIIPEHLDAQTVEVVALKLAATLAVILIENMELKQLMLSEHNAALAQARNTWAVEEFPQSLVEGPWLRRR